MNEARTEHTPFAALADIARAHAAGAWDGDSPEDLIRERYNCRRAELHDCGDIYIEDPQSGHYITEDDARDLVAWIRARGKS